MQTDTLYGSTSPAYTPAAATPAPGDERSESQNKTPAPDEGFPSPMTSPMATTEHPEEARNQPAKPGEDNKQEEPRSLKLPDENVEGSATTMKPIPPGKYDGTIDVKPTMDSDIDKSMNVKTAEMPVVAQKGSTEKVNEGEKAEKDIQFEF
nr:unnamed protein product [Haemonchus contortus]